MTNAITKGKKAMKQEATLTPEARKQLREMVWHSRKANCIKRNSTDVIYNWKTEQLTRGHADRTICKPDLIGAAMVLSGAFTVISSIVVMALTN